MTTTAVLSRPIGEHRIEELKKTIEHTRELMRDRSRRIGEGLTDMDDCFISERSNQQTITGCEMKINILENKGLSQFEVLVDIDTDEIVSDGDRRYGEYGGYWVMNDEYYKRTGKRYVGDAKRESTFTKKGVRKEYREFPAWVYFSAGGGSGLMGAYTGSYRVFRSDKNYYTEK
jgi:hypothetical protein